MQEKTKKAVRKALDPYRKGEATVSVAFAPRSLMFVKDCPNCKETCPYTLPKHQFACAGCRSFFD